MVKGLQSIEFKESPYLVSSASVAGKKEGEGPIGKMFDMVAEEDLFGENTWEEAESTMQKEACLLAMGKAHVQAEDVRYLFGGDLLRQGVATSMGVRVIRGVFHIRRSIGSGVDVCGGGVWRLYACGNLQPLWKRRERISLSAWICESETVVRPVDRNRKRRVSGRNQTEPCKNHRCNDRKDCRLWIKRFAEYGSMYGARCLRYDYTESG